MTIIPPARAAALVSYLLELHQSLSWRHIAKQYFPDVPPGTLNRIANSGGGYLPKERRELRALGLLEPRRKATEYRAVTEAYCEDCEQIWNGRAAHRDGREHFEKYHHRVRVVQTVMRVYDPRKENENV